MLTDTFHKPGFKLQTRILHHLFSVVQTDAIKGPLWDAAALGPAAYPSNAAFVQAHVAEMLATSFPNLRPQQVQATVLGMLELKEAATFKQHLRDFLVQSNQFADQNNADLYADEVAAAVSFLVSRGWLVGVGVVCVSCRLRRGVSALFLESLLRVCSFY